MKSKNFSLPWRQLSQAEQLLSKKWMVTAARAYIGRFPDEVAAARAYDAFVIANNRVKPLNFLEAPRGKSSKT